MATLIADTACVDPRAELGDEVEIGPYCVVGPGVKVGRGTRLVGHVCLLGGTELGEGNVVWPFAVLGGDPQDTSYRGEPTRVIVGDRNVIREAVTIHGGTAKEDGATRVGSDNYLMAGCHVAHDCRLADRVTIANGTMLGGHVRVGPYASLSGGAAIHHYVTIGEYSFVGGQSKVVHDVPPFMLIDGNPSKVRCINSVGLKRGDVPKASISALHEAHRLMYRARMNPDHAEVVLSANGHLTPEVAQLLEFVRAQHAGKHGRARERGRR
jgi:UDP-N-acetylglucosamine acyltransferase